MLVRPIIMTHEQEKINDNENAVRELIEDTKI